MKRKALKVLYFHLLNKQSLVSHSSVSVELAV